MTSIGFGWFSAENEVRVSKSGVSNSNPGKNFFFTTRRVVGGLPVLQSWFYGSKKEWMCIGGPHLS